MLLPRGAGNDGTRTTPGRPAPTHWSCTPAAGREEQVATWKGLPGKTMRLTGATATGRTDITTVEVRTADGKVLFTLPV